MKAVIVAAGMGTRLFPLTEQIPKCMVPVNGKPILGYQLEVLKQNGINDVIIVVGHMGEQIIEYTSRDFSDDMKFSYVWNHDYKSTQNAYSLFLARDLLTTDESGFVIFNSDLVFEPAMLQDLLESQFKDGMMVDQPRQVTNDMVKVELDGTRIINMSKDLADEKTGAEAVGPVKLSQAGGEKFFQFLEDTFRNEGVKKWLFYTLGDFGKQYPFHAIANTGNVWVEIDTVDDHKEAEATFSTKL